MTSLTERVTTQRDTLLEGHRQEVLRLQQEASERNCRLSEAVSALKATVIVISPEMEELRRQYLTLKTYCRQLPTIIRCAVEQTTKRVSEKLSVSIDVTCCCIVEVIMHAFNAICTVEYKIAVKNVLSERELILLILYM